MMEYVQAFIKRISVREPVLLLIENVDLTISFADKEEAAAIVLHNGEVQLAKDLNRINDIAINGNKASLKELLEGKDTLRKMMKSGDLQVSAPFRTLLFLESLFYFGKSNQNII